MKYFKLLIAFLLVTTIILFTKCGGDENDLELSEEDLMTEKLAKTWVITSGSVLVDNEVVTADFTNFTISISSNGTYTSNATSLTRTPNPWSPNGTLHYGGTVDAPNLNQLIRDDGLTISFFVDETNLQMSFTFSDEHKDSTGGKIEVINGNWVFEFTAV